MGFESKLVGTKSDVVETTLANLGSAQSVGARRIVTDYGRTIAISDGVRWRLERLYLAWADLPPASLVPAGTEASVIDCGGATAVASVVGWVFRPIEVFNSSAAVLISGSVGSSDQVGYQFTVPANLLGTKGSLSIEVVGTFSVASANSKILKMKLGATTLSQLSYQASHKSISALGRLKNITKSSQIIMDGQIFTFGGSGGGVQTATVDTSVDTVIQLTMAMGSTAETCTFHGVRATLYPAM